MFTIKKYAPEDRQAWDKYVAKARNGYFLFFRNYMEYHRDRFTDHSLLFYKDSRLFAILPANREGDTLVSHRGLTFGGLLMDIDVCVSDTITLFQEMNDYLRREGFRKVIYSPVPWVYHQHASEEDLYPLFWNCKARIRKRDVGTVIFLQQHLRWRKDRRRRLKQAYEMGVTVERTTDFAPFWKVLEDNLLDRHGVRPVHTLQEMELLYSRFPDNIVQYNAMLNGQCIAGMTFYIYGNVVHGQYCSSNQLGKDIGAVNCIYDRVMYHDFADYQYLDFGRSTEGAGDILNHGLVAQKEGFGGRCICYDSYEYDL